MNTVMNDSNSTTQKVKTGVLLLAHGAPDKMRDIPDYLKRIRGGISSKPEVVREIAGRYKEIGGSSPLLKITQAQASALEAFLNQGGDDFKVYVGMRNWYPLIEQVVGQAKKDGVERLVAMCLAPQYSKWSTGRYLDAFNAALGTWNMDNLPVKFITSWPNQPSLIDAFVERYQQAEARLKAEGHEDFHTIFTVHSVPAAYSEAGMDPYPEEYNKTMQGILSQVNISNWHQAYQSQGMIPVPWLGPPVERVLDKIARYGKKTVLVVPVGFVSDHIEVLYDIDIEFKDYAKKKNLDLHRTESMNLSPLFIETLAALVWERMV